MTLYVNLFAGPGAGKSTVAAGVFYELKMSGVNAELVPEFAKTLVWEDRKNTLANQIYVSAKQFEMITRLQGKADVIVCDSPVFLGTCYVPDDYPVEWEDTLFWMHQQTSTEGLNFFLRRDMNSFQEKGRVHNFLQSLEKDEEIMNSLGHRCVFFEEVDKSYAVNKIHRQVLQKLKEK